MGFKLKPSTNLVHVFADILPSILQETLEMWLSSDPDARVLHLAQSQNSEGLITLTIMYAKL